MYHHSNNTIYSQILMIALTLKALDLLLKQSLHGIVVFYTQKNTQRGKHSLVQGIMSLEAIFRKRKIFQWEKGEMTEEEEQQQQEHKDKRTYKTTRASSRSKMETVLICEVMCNADHKSSYNVKFWISIMLQRTRYKQRWDYLRRYWRIFNSLKTYSKSLF